MKLLWITWKDMSHPEAGGAEVVCVELCKRLVADGHEVTILTADYPGAKPDGHTPGVRIIRIGGNRYLLPLQALWYYLRNLRNQFDVLIEEVQGGAPYYTVLFEKRARKFLLYHQLARINWLYEVPSPVSYVGYYVLVPLATRFMSLFKIPVISVSESTKRELAKYGMLPSRTHIISEGLQVEPIPNVREFKKYALPTVLSHGSMRAMKRTIDQIKAFEIAKQTMPDLQMKISGSSSGAYGKQVLAYIAQSPHTRSIEYLGRTTDKQKTELMRKAHAIVVTSIEEGWGLIVTEANSQGTPAVVYDVAGLHDSVKNGETGIVTAENPKALAAGITQLIRSKQYEQMRKAGWEWSRQLTFDQSYRDLLKIVGA